MSAADKQNRGNRVNPVNFGPVDDDFRETSMIEDTGVKIPTVRRLSRPPEIWELVQPVPASRTGFASPLTAHLPSSRSILILVVAVIVCVGGYIGMRSGKRIAATTPSVVMANKVSTTKAAATVKQEPVQEASVTAPAANSSVIETTAVAESDKQKRKAPRRSKPAATATQVGNSSAVSRSASSAEASQVSLPVTQKAQSSANTSKTSSVDSAPSRKETSLSPQLINSSKHAPGKPKLIHWP